MKNLTRLIFVTALFAVLLFTFPCLGIENQYIEDFETTLYKDAVNTTANWDTDFGRLRLFPFVPTLAGSYNTRGTSHAVSVSGDCAFVADDTYGLCVIDISFPTNPVSIGVYNTPGVAMGVAVSGDCIFVADYYSGLQVIDISDPANPSLLANYNTAGRAMGVAISGDCAFVADYNFGVQILDISNPASPTFLGAYDTPGLARNIKISGDYAYVADDVSGLQILNISDPANLTHIGTYDSKLNSILDVVVSGDYAYVADNISGLRVIDISNPFTPTLFGSCNTPGRTLGVTVSGNFALLADENPGLQVIDISDPANPTLMGTCDTPGQALGVTVSGRHAFVADGSSGLQVIEITDYITPTGCGDYNTLGEAYTLTVSGDYAYVADGTSGLQILDIHDPANPILLGTCDTPFRVYNVEISGDYAFASDSAWGVQIIDISDPTNPTIARTYDTPGEPHGLAISGDFAVVADWSDGYLILDVSDPVNPTLLAADNSLPFTWDVAIEGNNAYFASGAYGLRVIDISDPTNPLSRGACDTPGYATDIAISGNYAYIADQYEGIQVMDISNPGKPTLIGNYDTPGRAMGVTVSGNYAFAADYDFGLQVIDISNPRIPTFLGTWDTPGYAEGVVVSGDHAYVGDLRSGMQVIQVFNGGPNLDGNVGRSLNLNESDDNILRVRMETVQNEAVQWDLSANNGGNWQGMVPDGNWNKVIAPGSDLSWRSTLTREEPGDTPEVLDLQIDWLVADPSIEDIVDVPDDDGGWVQLDFLRSGRDFLDETVYGILDYEIWRRVNNDALIATLNSASSLPTAKNAGGNNPGLSGVPVVTYHGSTYIQSPSGLADTSFPPGTWELVATDSAVQQDIYSFIVPTVADSTATGINYSVFVAVACTATPSIFYVSEPDSGYSVDSVAPGVPTSITAGYQASGVALDWDDAPETDVEFYHVYRDVDPGFVPSAGNLLAEVSASAWTDPTADPWAYYYKITAVDFSGNESEDGSPTSVSGIQGGDVPTKTALLGAVPNPFNPSAKLSFELATAGHVRLKVFDAAGRLVRTLVDEHHAAGRHDQVWNGQDSAGRMCSAGVYLYRLEAADFIETKRMVLIK
ncbi:MAG: T9SS type A sorting domain-containing protein [Gemmatimonadales bacterium]|nr:T9SS type A sorting domain-containing protein [Gemmatimonadales bacterium]